MTSWSFSCTDTSPGFDHYLARNTHWPFRWETEVDTIKSIFLLWFPPTLSRFLSALPLSLIILFWTTHPLRLLLRWQTPAAVYAVFGEKHLKAWWANRSVYTEACCVFFTGGGVAAKALRLLFLCCSLRFKRESGCLCVLTVTHQSAFIPYSSTLLWMPSNILGQDMDCRL